MHLNHEDGAQVIDLGDIVAETKGGLQNGNDTALQPQQFLIELADD